MTKTEMRLDPLRQTWTLFSAARASSPPLPSRRAAESFSGQPSPFAPGNEACAPHALYTASSPGGGWQLRVIPNRAPALRVEGRPSRRADGFYDCMDGVGAHEVIVETPGSAPLEDLSIAAIGEVITAWKCRMLDLLKDFRLRSFFIVKEVGESAGQTIPHSVSQLIAIAVVPAALRSKLEASLEFYDRKKRSIFEDILAAEVREGSRLVYENNGFSSFCPYASRVPFELAIYPKRQCADFHGITDQETVQLADLLKTALAKLNLALGHPAYQLLLFTAPTRAGSRDFWRTLDEDFRWHIEIVPALFPHRALESATGCYVNAIWPETAAQALRER